MTTMSGNRLITRLPDNSDDLLILEQTSEVFEDVGGRWRSMSEGYWRLGRRRSCRQVKKAIASVKSTAMPA